VLGLITMLVGAFAEFERALIRERQAEGIAQAKKRGAYKGRKKALTPQQVVDIRSRVGAGEAKAALAREYGVSRETLCQHRRSGA
jgi:DNA invertase Pin-like site-specific DNA recombinase